MLDCGIRAAPIFARRFAPWWCTRSARAFKLVLSLIPFAPLKVAPGGARGVVPHVTKRVPRTTVSVSN